MSTQNTINIPFGPFVRNLGLGILTLLCSVGCERDDICSSETRRTPQLQLRFFNKDARSNAKSVNQLQIKLLETADLNYVKPRIPTNLSSLSVPLDTTRDTTRLVLILNAGVILNEVSTQDPDTLIITYLRKTRYISRACGYGINFENLRVRSASNDPSTWVESLNTDITTVDQSNAEETHLSIYH